jgi:Helix-loop-helix DNA-binding domain
MPRPTLPPTPASSTDIKGKDGPHFGQMSFELPPPAMTPSDSRPSSASTKSSSASSYHPTSPKSPAVAPPNVNSNARRRSSAAQANAKDVFTLPPPPTRSRKIIQMKPRGQPDMSADMEADTAKGPASKAVASTTSKKKQPSATSVAGRKIARKTAHSLIERRRRSKMNEEFGVLKSMIPACTGEMHKLAILQVSLVPSQTGES